MLFVKNIGIGGKMNIKKSVILSFLFLISLFVNPIYSSSAEVSKNIASVMIVSATPNRSEMEAMKYYSKHAKKLLFAAGGKPIGGYKVSEEVYGKNSPALFFIVEFPNELAIRNFLNSREYKKLIPYRDKAFEKVNIYIAKKR